MALTEARYERVMKEGVPYSVRIPVTDVVGEGDGVKTRWFIIG